MKTKLKVTLGSVLVCFAVIGNAQQRPERPSPEEMLKKVTEELSLTDEQVEDWKAIHEKYGEEMRSDPRATMPKVEAEIEEILTEEQWEKFEELKPRKRKRRREG